MQGDKSPPLELTFLGAGNAFVGDRYWSSFRPQPALSLRRAADDSSRI